MKRSTKGVTRFDKLCHTVHALFHAREDGTDYFARPSGIRCGHCAGELKTYYCEERLYVVVCERCGTMALAEARSPAEAVYKTLGHAVYPIDDMSEDLAVFFCHLPVDDPPVYVGSTIDRDFPWDEVACGMYLPFLGTNGEEMRGKED